MTGRKSLTDLLREALEKMRGDIDKFWTTRLLQYFPRTTEEDLVAVLGPYMPVFDDTWTQAQENELQRVYAAHPMCAAIDKVDLRSDGVSYSLKAWKVAVRFYRCTPFDIISEANRLRFREEHEELPGPTGITLRNPFWAPPFAEQFSAIMLHPLWDNGNRKALVITLQYLAICQANDQRIWHIDYNGLDGFIYAFRHDFIQHPTPCSIRLRHDRVVEALTGLNDSRFSRLFRAIEALVLDEDDPPIINQGFDQHPYFLDVWGIRQLNKALCREGGMYGFDTPCTPAALNHLVYNHRGSNDVPNRNEHSKSVAHIIAQSQLRDVLKSWPEYWI